MEEAERAQAEADMAVALAMKDASNAAKVSPSLGPWGRRHAPSLRLGGVLPCVRARLNVSSAPFLAALFFFFVFNPFHSRARGSRARRRH